MNNKTISLIPYLNFDGNCEEALNNYAKILNGRVEVITRYNIPAMKAPDHYKDKILHARLYFQDNVLYASDAFPGKAITRGYGDTSLSLAFPDAVSAKSVFDQLADGGEINVAFEKQFWGDWHGNLVDRFGIRWMVNCEK